MSPLLAFDLETTGLDTGVDRVIEFCFLSLDENLQVTGRYQSLVNPEKPIPPESSAIHGLTDTDQYTDSNAYSNADAHAQPL